MRDVYLIFRNINNVLGTVLSVLLFYRVLYFPLGLFLTRKFKPAKEKHKYAIVVAARNEETVIGNLLDSISKQDYPKELTTVFVVADNCTDNTAEISRKNGAMVYERFNDTKKTKGYALEYLFECIKKDYGIESFEAYFVFDADNLLNKDYINKMNDAFDNGEKVVTSYRSTKNFDENWISASYAIHWLRTVRYYHRTRSFFGLATNIQGTGFMFANEIVKDGWKWTTLTEDRLLTADAVGKGYFISYHDEAIFYDEQPVDIKIALRQRLRWSKGNIQGFCITWKALLKNIFLGAPSLKGNFKADLRNRIASFDIFFYTCPLVLLNVVRWLLISIILYPIYAFSHGIYNINLISKSTYVGKFINLFFSTSFNINPGIQALYMGLLLTIYFRILFRIFSYIQNTLIAVYVFVFENRRIEKINIWKKLWFIITFPIFDIIGRYTSYIAPFVNVSWKPIPHTSQKTINDIKN